MSELPTNKVYVATNEETRKYFRIFSDEQLDEMRESGRLDGYRISKMSSNEGLGGGRGVKRDRPKMKTVSY